MRPSYSALYSLLSLTFISNASSASIPHTAATDAINRAEQALSALQIWYNAGTGLWDTTGWWNSANVLTMISNLAKYDAQNTQVQNLARNIFATTIVKAPAKNPQPGVEDAAVRRRSEDGTEYQLFNGSLTGYHKSIGPDGQSITEYPPGWEKSTSAYVDVSTLPINQLEGAAAAAPNASQWLDGFYDDDLWWALGWIGAYDVTKKAEYLQLAEGIFKAVTKAWPTNCGNGGIWWSFEKNYANAIANELFLSTAAHMANRVDGASGLENKAFYVNWAQRELDWFLKSGMINSGSTINDGLTSDCKNNGQNTWSYNQGVILGGLVELNRAAPNSTYLPLAARIAKAAIAKLADSNGVIHDTCEPNCGGDGTQFKGIFARNLQLLHAAAPDSAYVESIQTNAESIWANDRDEGNRFSVNWAGPFVRPANASTHSSAMDALVAAITVK